jgi:hypothetical protein
MTLPTIEKGIPIPTNGKNGSVTELLRTLEVGDSILLAGRLITAAQPLIRNAAKKSEREYTSRTVEGGVRIWRTK